MNQNEENNLRPVAADGIHECDNPLPKWWVGLFIFTIVFAIVYMSYYYIFGGSNQIEKFNLAMSARNAQQTEVGAAGGDDVEERLASQDVTEDAKNDFSVNCSPCHLADGSGQIGPNLTDEYWLQGGSAGDIVKTISEGDLEKGMPAWKDILGRKKIEELTVLILSWRGKILPGKEPQGEKYEPTQ